MSTERKSWISDKNFFWLTMGITLAVLSLVVLLKFIPDGLRPNFAFAKHLPLANAFINTTVGVFIFMGYRAIRFGKNKAAHQKWMLAAFVLSAVFLLSYVLKGIVLPETKYGGEGVLKYIYFFILLTHILLAAIILPLVLYTLYFASKGNFVKHKKIARITFPIWMYVAITGPLVYILISPYYPF